MFFPKKTRTLMPLSINSLILSGFSLTSFHLTEASLSASSLRYTLVCAVDQNITKCLLFTNIHVFSFSFPLTDIATTMIIHEYKS